MSLTPEQSQQLRERLEQREAELRSEVRAAREAASENAVDASTEVDDLAAAGEARLRSGIEHAELQRDLEELLAIEQAHSRMRAGEYGDCVDCGLEIPYERLQAQPSALRCIPCQSVWEREHQAAPRYVG